MTITLYAQPYDLAASGFYFSDIEIFRAKSKALKNDYGDPVEEFEIQFIDSDSDIDCDLTKAFAINQTNIARFFECAEQWEEWEKVKFIIAVGECSYSFDPENMYPDDFEVDIYYVKNMRELAEQFVDEGLFGEIPEPLRFYIDYDAIARDLAMDYGEAVIAGGNVIYRCG